MYIKPTCSKLFNVRVVASIASKIYVETLKFNSKVATHPFIPQS